MQLEYDARLAPWWLLSTAHSRANKFRGKLLFAMLGGATAQSSHVKLDMLRSVFVEQ
jgi:hypothetical protein